MMLLKISELKSHLKICVELYTKAMDYEFKMPIIINRHSGSELGLWRNLFIKEKMSHYISINLVECENTKELHSTILHELVHAMQYENNLPVEHNDIFLDYVVMFGKMGYNLSCEDFTKEQLLNAFYRNS